MCIYTNLTKDACDAENNEHVRSFENDARLSHVHPAAIMLTSYSMRLTNLDARRTSVKNDQCGTRVVLQGSDL